MTREHKVRCQMHRSETQPQSSEGGGGGVQWVKHGPCGTPRKSLQLSVTVEAVSVEWLAL